MRVHGEKILMSASFHNYAISLADTMISSKNSCCAPNCLRKACTIFLRPDLHFTVMSIFSPCVFQQICTIKSGQHFGELLSQFALHIHFCTYCTYLWHFSVGLSIFLSCSYGVDKLQVTKRPLKEHGTKKPTGNTPSDQSDAELVTFCLV